MKTFDYTRAGSTEEAVLAINSIDRAMFLGGGTNLIDLMKEGGRTARPFNRCN